MEACERRMAAVLADVAAANADDPRTTTAGGAPRAYEVVYSERMAARLAVMYPAASELLRIAAHAQHIRRWDIPRARYPAGRDGYNAWRGACRDHHATLTGAILARHGYSPPEIAHVAKLIRKQQLKKDPESQALENVVAVVFVEHYIQDFLASHAGYSEDKLVDILGKTLRKMSPKGHITVTGLALPETVRRLIDKALAREADTLAKLAKTAVD